MSHTESDAAPAAPETETTPAQPAEGAAPDPDVMAARLAQIESEYAVVKDQALRALAEIENIRRRAEREREDAAKYGSAALARDVLSVADNLRRAIEAVPGDARAGNETLNALIEGVEATERELLSIFERRSIKRINPTGERFDPNFHQAMFEVAASGQAPGTVVQVLQAGYVMHERLLRPALVGVAKDDGTAGHVDTRA